MKRLTMRKIREALRLHTSGLSTRKIATSLGVGQSTASEYLKRIEQAALTWPLAAEMTDAALEELLFQPAWHDVIDEPTFADAILNRLVHNAYRLELDGHSVRRSTNATEKVDEGPTA